NFGPNAVTFAESISDAGENIAEAGKSLRTSIESFGDLDRQSAAYIDKHDAPPPWWNNDSSTTGDGPVVVWTDSGGGYDGSGKHKLEIRDPSEVYGDLDAADFFDQLGLSGGAGPDGGSGGSAGSEGGRV